MTNQEIITRGELIRDETVTGANTAQRVGEAFVGIGQNLEELANRGEPIVFTESKEMNAFIKHLFVDVSECSVSYDVSNLYASFFNNGNGTIYIALWDSPVGGNSLTSYIFVNRGKGVYCTRIYDPANTYRDRIYVYVEVNEDLFPQSSLSTRAKLTSWCFSPSCDPRLKDVGVTENPLVNKFLSALYVDLTNYTGEFEDIKNGLRLYGLWNSVAQNTQYYLGFMDADGIQCQLWSNNTKPSTILDESFNISDKGKLRIVAKVNWEALVGNIWGSQRLRLNPCIFEKEYFYAIIEQPEGGDGDSDVITIDSLKSQFSTRVFTKSAKHNQIIKKLFIDTSGYTGDTDLSEGVELQQLAKNIGETHTHGIQLRSVKDKVTLGSFWIYSANSKQEQSKNGIYLYAEYDWDAFPEDTSKQYGPALLTNEAFNPINDPRKSVGYNNLSDEVKEMLTGQGGGGNIKTPLTGGVYGSVGDSITAGAGVATNLDSNDPCVPISGGAKATYGYFIAKINNMNWHNYGISGSTLGDVTANGASKEGFSKANGRYTQLANDLTHISIFFGWNDNAYGHVMKREEWLLEEYGTKIYYPTNSSLIGTTHADGTPYTTQSQYDACNAQTGTVNGVSYSNSADYWSALYIGTPNDSTPYTFWGAWNTVLPYLINKYPLAKILLIVPYLSVSTEIGKLLQNTVRLAAHKFGLCYFDFNKSDSQLFSKYGWMDESTPSGQVNGMTIRNFRGDAGGTLFNNGDGTHPNENGYKYMYPSINAKLCSI